MNGINIMNALLMLTVVFSKLVNDLFSTSATFSGPAKSRPSVEYVHGLAVLRHAAVPTPLDLCFAARSPIVPVLELARRALDIHFRIPLENALAAFIRAHSPFTRAFGARVIRICPPVAFAMPSVFFPDDRAFASAFAIAYYILLDIFLLA